MSDFGTNFPMTLDSIQLPNPFQAQYEGSILSTRSNLFNG